MGPGGVKVPGQTQAIPGLGTKKVSDLISEDFRFSIAGTTVTASGTVKNVSEPWMEYSKTDNTGHFVPTQLPAACAGQKITLEGRKSGGRTVKVGQDLLLIQRLENLSGDTLTVKMGGKVIMTVDFSGVQRGE